jgi:spermidine/putrescine transport system permease protein
MTVSAHSDNFSKDPAPLAARFLRFFLLLYLGIFFFYLFSPLLVMASATFNTSRFPTITPWLGFTLDWVWAMLEDRQMGSALVTSMLVGGGVVGVSLPTGLAAALVLRRLSGRVRGVLYTLMVSPILLPGVVIGIATLLFWQQHFGLSGGIIMTILAQSSFISAYVMLLVLARLDRFDPSLEEAALSLGASHILVLRRIVLPYLKPSLYAASFLAFLQSFENYNTTLFVRGLDTTLTVYIASKVRTGVTPAVNALGLILILLTILGAIIYEILRRQRLHMGEEDPGR